MRVCAKSMGIMPTPGQSLQHKVKGRASRGPNQHSLPMPHPREAIPKLAIGDSTVQFIDREDLFRSNQNLGTVAALVTCRRTRRAGCFR